MPVLPVNPNYYSVNELFDGRTGTPWSIDGHREYLRRFRVVVKRKDMGPVDVRACPGVPQPGSLYVTPLEYDLLAVASSIECRQEFSDDWKNWIVEVHYQTRMPPGGFPIGQEVIQNNPELEPPDVEWDYEVVQLAHMFDLDGFPFVNVVGEPYSPAPSFPTAYPILSITRNELNFDAVRAAYYSFALNDDTFLGYPPETVQCLPPKAKMAFRGTKIYWRVSYKLRFSYLVDDANDPDYEIVTAPPPPPGLGIAPILPSPPVSTKVGLRKLQPRILEQATKYRNNAGVKIPFVTGGARYVDNVDRFGKQIVSGNPGHIIPPGPLGGTPIKVITGKAGVKMPTYTQYRVYRKVSLNDLLTRGVGG